MLITPKQQELIKRRLYWTASQIGQELQDRIIETLNDLDRRDASTIIDTLIEVEKPDSMTRYEDMLSHAKEVLTYTLKNYPICKTV